MAEFKLTEQQQLAVDCEGGALLVSAAAGSGKTKVLVDRVLRKVCVPERPHNIDEFLIITYTKAAASELRSKLATAIGKRLAAEPDNRHLQRQLSRIYLAQISTVHSFCTNIIRDYAHELGIYPDFRVAEEQECAVWQQQAMEQVLDQAYHELQRQPEQKAFIDLLAAGRDDRAAPAILMQAYRSIQCHPDPDAWVQQCMQQLQMEQYDDMAQTPWGALLLEDYQQFLQGQIAALTRAYELALTEAQTAAKYAPVLEENLRLLREQQSYTTWDEVYVHPVSSFGTLGRVTKFEDKAFLERIKKPRKTCWEQLKKKRETFAASSAEVLAELDCTAQAIRGMFRLVERFSAAYQAEKQRRRALDFNDLEHEALRLLRNRSGTPTPQAKEIAGRYCEIMVDEYQDSNAVQDAIITLVSRAGQNVFMVGDIKQSIYRFRLADPGIFLQKYQSFVPACKATAGQPRKVVLSQNFRSREQILQAVNDVFRLSMSESVGDLAYGEDEALHPGLMLPPLTGPKVELHCIDASETSEDLPKRRAEAQFVAARIAQLLQDPAAVIRDGQPQPARPEDIVILLRSLRSQAGYYMDALRARGIACVCDQSDDILQTAEVQVLLSLLQVVDNPHHDIPLISVLASPVYGYSAEQVAQVRVGRRNGDFFDALCADAEQHETFRLFLQQLAQLRQLAKELPVHALLTQLLRMTRLDHIFGAMEGGVQRMENLQSVCALAAGFDANGPARLQDFLRQIERQRERGITGSGARSGNAVRILSIHKSKGLEFPIVVLAGLSTKFNRQDAQQPVQIHPQLGAGCDMVDLKHRVRYPSAAKKAIVLQAARESRSEELRVLYVAMTRPKERLIMVYTSAHLPSTLQNIVASLEPANPAAAAAQAASIGHWVLMAALCRPEAGALHQLGGRPDELLQTQDVWDIRLWPAGCVPQAATAASERCAEPERDYAAAQGAMAFSYSHCAACNAPTKLTATQLKGRFLDEESAAQTPSALQLPQLRKPMFLRGRRPLSRTEQGTAVHLAMQYIRYEACGSADGVRAELQRMVREGFLLPEQADCVKPEKIVALFTGPLGQQILAAEQVVREFKFSLLVDARLQDPALQGEQLMLQGVTDCCLLEADGLTVIDFKTDHVLPGQEAQRAAHYRGQLAAYSQALSRIFGLPVRKKLLYFFATDQVYEL